MLFAFRSIRLLQRVQGKRTSGHARILKTALEKLSGNTFDCILILNLLQLVRSSGPSC